MAKPRNKKRYVEITPEFLAQVDDLTRRARETDRRIDEALKRAEAYQRRLREIAAQG